ncbi:hypothetical protein PM8797T_19350 [Gimesia maris DSM 8797]|nr:hypothetical protein PM8797T_19350 [Gimesia maris DSM 8797]
MFFCSLNLVDNQQQEHKIISQVSIKAGMPLQNLSEIE